MDKGLGAAIENTNGRQEQRMLRDFVENSSPYHFSELEISRLRIIRAH